MSGIKQTIIAAALATAFFTAAASPKSFAFSEDGKVARLERDVAALQEQIITLKMRNDPAFRKAVVEQYLYKETAAVSGVENVNLETVSQVADELSKTGNVDAALKRLNAVASPDDLTALVIFSVLNKLSRGQAVTLDNFEQVFVESLPEKWVPVYEQIKANHPKPGHFKPARKLQPVKF